MENFHQSVVHSEQQLTLITFFSCTLKEVPNFRSLQSQTALNNASSFAFHEQTISMALRLSHEFSREAVLKIAAEGTCDEEMKGAMGIGLRKIEKMEKEFSTT